MPFLNLEWTSNRIQFFGEVDLFSVLSGLLYRNEWSSISGILSKSSHGASWKACCRKIGALPSRLYNPKVEEINLHMENKQKKLDSQIESIKQGNMVIHPTYGIGIVNNISDDKRKLYINFNNEMRCLSAPWVTEHCQIVK